MEPLRPDPADEGTHTPGHEPLWNESWYFDGIADDGSLGVYVRTGRVPNQGHCLFTAFVAGPGRPTVMLAHTAAPLPPMDDPAQAIHVDGLDAEQHCDDPLERFRVTLEGTGQSFDDPRPSCAASRARTWGSCSNWPSKPRVSRTGGAAPPATRSPAG